MNTAPAIYIHAHLLAGGEALVWELASWPDGPKVRIAFHASCNEKAQRRRTFESGTHTIARVAERDPEQVDWLAIGRRTWKIDASRLRFHLAIVRHRACADVWSNLAGVVRVEYEERIKETFLALAKFLGALRPGRPIEE